MNVRRTILLAAAAVLASRASAEGTAGDAQQPPKEQSQGLGQRGAGAVKKGATGARDEVNKGGQWLNEKVVGKRTVSGRVADVSADQVTVKKSDGTPMSLRVTKSTKVTIGGKKGAVDSLQRGDEVRASYAESGGAATASQIDVKRTPRPLAPGRTAPSK